MEQPIQMLVVSLVAVAVNKLILLHMFEKIEILLRQLVNNFDEIPAERKVILQKNGFFQFFCFFSV